MNALVTRSSRASERTAMPVSPWRYATAIKSEYCGPVRARALAEIGARVTQPLLDEQQLIDQPPELDVAARDEQPPRDTVSGGW